ncbi:MAG: ABC transporter ATP-binding protein [Holosporales bacterium]|jgi:lipoprotein-releasing system ATP-binding protein|nr:ABC transporter ATP-binding protein [Holosporales bacterium]
MRPEETLKLEKIYKSYKSAQGSLAVLQGVSLTVSRGEMVALLGPSGTGKSTLLHIAGLLDQPDTGALYLLGESCSRATDTMRTQWRRHHIGFVYQFHHLMPELTALENIVLPQRLVGTSVKEAEARAWTLLEQLGLVPRAHHLPSALSGGEQQRIAVARALANTPALLLADEPTGNLDGKTAQALIQDLVTLSKTWHFSALIATHNIEFAHCLDRRVQLQNGVLHNA